MIGATSAVFETVTVGPSGDDFTGLLVIPAGLVLLGLSVVVLWRSRRLDDSLRRRYTRRTLIVSAAALVGAFIVFPIGLGYGTTHVMRKSVPDANLGASHQNVSFTTSDGLELRAGTSHRRTVLQ